MTWQAARDQQVRQYKPPNNIRDDTRLLYIVTIDNGRRGFGSGEILKLYQDDYTGAPEFMNIRTKQIAYVNWYRLAPYNFKFND